jgi:hypothetical protein
LSARIVAELDPERAVVPAADRCAVSARAVGSSTPGPHAGCAGSASSAVSVDAIFYFLSRREADADSNRFLAAVVPQLADFLQEDSALIGAEQFRVLWQRAQQAAAASSRHLLVVVDGLDEDLRPPGSPSVAALLPADVGANAHVLVSSRPYPEPPADVRAGHPLRATTPIELTPFAAAAELATLARQEIDQLTRSDGDLQFSTVIRPTLYRSQGRRRPPKTAARRRARGCVSRVVGAPVAAPVGWDEGPRGAGVRGGRV